MQRNPTKDETSTFTVHADVIYTTTRTSRARTVTGALAAVRAGLEYDNPGAHVRVITYERTGQPTAPAAQPTPGTRPSKPKKAGKR